MFFSLAKKPDGRFNQHEIIGSWYFSHDPGWAQDGESWSKGYYHEAAKHGNFLKICLDDQEISLVHDDYRSFPLWWNTQEKTLTNLCGDGDRIWASRKVRLNQDGIIIEKSLSNIFLDDSLSLDQVCDFLVDDFILKARCLNDAYPSVKKRLFVSGGADTLILYALAKNQRLDVDMINFEYFEYDWFTNHNILDIKKQHWAYNQIHHWTDDCFLLTGGCGDEYMFRGPHTIAIWAAWHDLDVINLCRKSQGYHVDYFLLDKNIKIFQEIYAQRPVIKERFRHKEHLVWHLLDINANDHQHWHLGKTLTWTPFKDPRLLEIILKLDYDTVVKQILDAAVNKQMIQRLDPESLSLLGSRKNHMPRQNLHLL